MIYYILILLLNMFPEYMLQNKIYDTHIMYHYFMSIYITLFLITIIWLYFNKIITETKNKIFDYIYTNIYDYFFGNPNFKLSTPNLFYYTIKKIKPNSRVLDFGCGNGICYSNQLIKDLIIQNNLQIQGIDIDKVYIEKCLQRIRNEKLESNVNIKLQDVLEYKIEHEEKYDYIILSESAPLLSEMFLKKIVKHMINNLLKEDGKIIFINNLTENSTPTMKKIKPLLKYLSMIDFGRVLTKEEFIYLSKDVGKNIEFNLICKMKLIKILKFFNIGWTFYFWNIIGIQNYEVEQYEIKFF